jgi:enamine deaminase RidA (YjgF/YER057c/UK114 family)
MRWMTILASPLFAALACTHSSQTLKHVNPASLPKTSGFTLVVEATGGRTLYVSGLIASDQSRNIVGKGDIRVQTREIFEKLKTALASSGATLDDVAKITIFMKDMADLQGFREVRDSYFKNDPPASSLVQIVSLVHPDALLEVEAVAVVPSDR